MKFEFCWESTFSIALSLHPPKFSTRVATCSNDASMDSRKEHITLVTHSLQCSICCVCATYFPSALFAAGWFLIWVLSARVRWFYPGSTSTWRGKPLSISQAVLILFCGDLLLSLFFLIDYSFDHPTFVRWSLWLTANSIEPTARPLSFSSI